VTEFSLSSECYFLSIRHRALQKETAYRTGQLKCDGTRAETRFRLSAERRSPFKTAGASVQSTTGSRCVSISGSNAGYAMFRGSVKGTGYPLHSPVSPSLRLPCAITFQLKSNRKRITKRIRNTLLPTVSFYKTVRDLYISRPFVPRFYCLCWRSNICRIHVHVWGQETKYCITRTAPGFCCAIICKRVEKQKNGKIQIALKNWWVMGNYFI